ncbi:hypothetical protein C4D60_Mb06t33280 [Musa balbisiana]|uniref:Ras-related protein Rab-21 n=1 Tax=Musa balbisiana TaxID=52838 RepID=A0A4S8IUZ4_MUSBA|nr:hypothetical protein C4D60_Mb06t33280 [Musa balbisiana]
MSSRARNLTFKLVLLGDGRVGKTSLVLRYVNNVFSEKQETTVQASYLTKRLVIGGVPITLSIWDTAGQERFHALGPIYYRDADGMYLINTSSVSFMNSDLENQGLFNLVFGDYVQEKPHYVSLLVTAAVLLVYDITDTDTFLRVRKWVKELQQMASNDIVMVIAANKSDLIRSKKYDIQESESYAMTIGAKLFLTSAKFGMGINDVFLDIAARLSQKKKNSAQGSSPALPRKGIIVVDDEPEREPPPKCCS